MVGVLARPRNKRRRSAALVAVARKVIAGGYNKTQSYAGMPIANRYPVFQFPDKATHDKVWTDTKAWAQKALNAGYMSEFRVIGAEAAQPM